MAKSAKTDTSTIKVRVSAPLREAIRRGAEQDEQAEGAWLRLMAITLLRKRGMWPPPQSNESDKESME